MHGKPSTLSFQLCVQGYLNIILNECVCDVPGHQKGHVKDYIKEVQASSHVRRNLEDLTEGETESLRSALRDMEEDGSFSAIAKYVRLNHIAVACGVAITSLLMLMALFTKTECDYLYGWITKRPKISPKMVNPKDITGNAEEEEVYGANATCFCLLFLLSSGSGGEF